MDAMHSSEISLAENEKGYGEDKGLDRCLDDAYDAMTTESVTGDQKNLRVLVNTKDGTTEDEDFVLEVDASRRWIELLVLEIGVTTIMSLWFSASIALPQFTIDLGLSTFESSLLVASVNLGFIICGLISAITMIADRFSPRMVMCFGGGVGCMVNAGLLLADGVGFWGLFILRFVTGMCLALVYPPGMKAASMWFVQYRGFVLGAVVGALTLGSSLPSLIRGASEEDVNWRWMVLASTGIAAVGVMIVFTFSHDGPYVTPLKVIRLSAVPKLFRTPSLVITIAAYACHNFELYAVWSWVSSFYSATIDDSTTSTANLFAFMTIGLGALGSVIGGWLADKFGRTIVCLFCTICSATISICIGPATYTQNNILVWSMAFIWGFTVVADSAQYSAMISELCPEDLVGTALTLQLSVGFGATIISILALPAIASDTSLGWSWSFSIAGGVSSIGIVLLLWLRRLPESYKIISDGVNGKPINRFYF
eukprot:CFRG3175T1